MAPHSEHAADQPPVMLLAAFHAAYPDQSPEWMLHAPGRELWLAAARSGNEIFTLASPDHDGRPAFSLQSAKQRQTVLRRPLPRWTRYPVAITLLLAHEGLELIGLNMLFMGEEPQGPRYDYAIGIGFAALWTTVCGAPHTLEQLIDMVDRARREYVG